MTETTETHQIPQEPPKRMLRRSENCTIGGVAAGLADYFDIEVRFVQLGFIIATFAGGAGVVAYLMAWLIIPSPSSQIGIQIPTNWQYQDLLYITGIGLGTVLIFTIADSSEVLVTLALLGGGLFLLNRRPGRDDELLKEENIVSRNELSSADSVVANKPSGRSWVRPGLQRKKRKEPTPPLFAITIAASVLLIGLALLGDQIGLFSLSAMVMFGLLVCICGAVIIASAYVGRSIPVILLSFIALLGLGVSAGIHYVGSIEPTRHIVANAAELDDVYSFDVGSHLLDLSSVSLEEDAFVGVSLDIGKLEIIVPDDINVQLNSSVEVGYFEHFSEEGFGSAYPSGGYEAKDTAPVLFLDSDLEVGALFIRSADDELRRSAGKNYYEERNVQDVYFDGKTWMFNNNAPLEEREAFLAALPSDERKRYLEGDRSFANHKMYLEEMGSQERKGYLVGLASEDLERLEKGGIITATEVQSALERRLSEDEQSPTTTRELTANTMTTGGMTILEDQTLKVYFSKNVKRKSFLAP